MISASDHEIGDGAASRAYSGAAGSAWRSRRAGRITKRRDYLAVQKQGRKIHLPHLLVFVLAGSGRFGMTVSSRVGNAVERNRVKRLLREVWREVGRELPAGYDIVLVAKKGAVEATLAELQRQVVELGWKLGR